MYRRLKNMLGVSLMILAVVLSQIPMPNAQADETSTVTFSMNGGEFNGEFNGYSFNNQTPVLVIDNNKTIDNYPDDQYASYAGYETENGKWYTDKECIEEFNGDSKISESVTIYKKWYNTEGGFCLNPDKTVLYRYDGDEKLVQIPDCVTTIAPNAFDSVENIRGIILPKDIETVYDDAFSGAAQGNSIIYIYDNVSSQSSEMAQKLAERYEQFVYSSYLDVDKVEEIAGIDYTAEEQAEESDHQADENKETETQTVSEEQKETQPQTETNPAEEEKREYTVTFDTGISGILGEKRTVAAHSTVSELVSISGEQPQILTKGSYTVESDSGKQEITYVFDGWYKDSACTTEWNFASDTVEGDTVIYAKWDRSMKDYFYVTFVADGADNVPEKVKLYEDEPLTEPEEKPTIKGKTFQGWFLDKEDSEKYVTWGKPLSGNLTLYAQWESEGYTVTFHMNGGKYSGVYGDKEYDRAESVKMKVEKGKGISKKAYPEYGDDAVFKYSGYNTDSEWYTDKNCLTEYERTGSGGNPKEVKKNLTLYKKWYATTSGFTMNADKTVLYKYSGSAGSVKIPETVKVIGEDAFTNINAVKSIALPDSLTDVDEDAFSGFEKASKDVTITAKSDRAITIAKELAAKYKHLVYEKGSESSDKEQTKSDSVSVINSQKDTGITLGAAVSQNTGTAKTAPAATGTGTAPNTAPSGLTLGASGTPAAGIETTGIGANSVTVGETQQTAASQAPMASDAIASQKPASQGGSTAPAVKAKTTSKTTSKSNATAESAPSGARHVKDSTPKTGDPVAYRMLLVCVLFSAGMLLVLTGNGRRKRFSPS
ncbi:hypothetical protein C809_01165 [Lachnospiraceae bacterium MD335]|jgi:uncharacterized repeat protein (TIGR02543 family)|nr:hypothetical protein C809_01165 [Lachnospiraceae bacterium MD335]